MDEGVEVWCSQLYSRWLSSSVAVLVAARYPQGCSQWFRSRVVALAVVSFQRSGARSGLVLVVVLAAVLALASLQCSGARSCLVLAVILAVVLAVASFQCNGARHHHFRVVSFSGARSGFVPT